MALIDPSKNDPNAEATKFFHKAGSPLKLNEGQKISLMHTMRYPEILFFAVPTKSFIQEMIEAKTDISKELPKDVVSSFSTGNGKVISQEMLIKYVDGSLDARNKYVIDNCDICYFGSIPECLKGLQ